MSVGFGFSLPALAQYGGGGNNPFGQLGPTLDLSFAGTVTDTNDPNGYTLNTNFITPQYQVAADYTIWETNVGLVSKAFGDIITFTRASTATYFDSAGVLTSAAINTPRFDYDPSTLAAQGLLIEEARTNVFTQSGSVVGAVGGWSVVRATSVAGAANSPDGTVSGAKLQEDTTASNTHYVFASSVSYTSGTTYTQSVFVKAAGRTQIQMSFPAGAFTTELCILYDLTAVTTTVIAGAPTGTITNVGNGWYRCTITATATATTTANTVTAYLASGGSLIYTGDGTSGVYLWGAQLEAGAFPTSYIPTTTTALTRAADVASVNTLSPWYNASEGTLFADWTSFIPNGTSPGSTYAAGFTDNITTSGAAQLTIQNRAASNQIRVWQSTTGGGLDDFITPTNTTFQGKAAATYGGGSNVNASANGGAVVTMTNPIQTTAFNALLLGLFTTAVTGSGSNYLNGHLRRVVYYPRRLSNAELQSITS